MKKKFKVFGAIAVSALMCFSTLSLGGCTVPAKQKKTLHVNVNRYFMQKENQREIAFVSITTGRF